MNTRTSRLTRRSSLFTVAALLLLSTACKGGDDSGAQPAAQPAPKPKPAKKPAASKGASSAGVVKDGVYTAPKSGVAKVTIEGNDMMQFNLKEIRVNKGQKVELTLAHVGKMAKEVMGHNWLVLKKDVDVAAFTTEAMAAKATSYVPSARSGEVLAHTKLLGGGEKDTITFTAPEPGEYVFLCSFPGHNALMRGKVIVSG